MQTSHWIPYWLAFTGAEQIPHGNFHCIGPGLTSTSLADISSMSSTIEIALFGRYVRRLQHPLFVGQVRSALVGRMGQNGH